MAFPKKMDFEQLAMRTFIAIKSSGANSNSRPVKYTIIALVEEKYFVSHCQPKNAEIMCSIFVISCFKRELSRLFEVAIR